MMARITMFSKRLSKPRERNNSGAMWTCVRYMVMYSFCGWGSFTGKKLWSEWLSMNALHPWFLLTCLKKSNKEGKSHIIKQRRLLKWCVYTRMSHLCPSEFALSAPVSFHIQRLCLHSVVWKKQRQWVIDSCVGGVSLLIRGQRKMVRLIRATRKNITWMDFNSKSLHWVPLLFAKNFHLRLSCALNHPNRWKQSPDLSICQVWLLLCSWKSKKK